MCIRDRMVSLPVLVTDTLLVMTSRSGRTPYFNTTLTLSLIQILIPESQEAWKEAEEFLRIVYGIRRRLDGEPVRRVKSRRKRIK